MSKATLKTSFKVESQLKPIYTGGCLQFSSQFNALFCTFDDSLNVVDYSTGKLTKNIEGDTSSITSFVLHPSKKELVVATESLQLRQYDFERCEYVKSWKAHRGVITCLEFGIEGGYLASGGTGRVVKVWDYARGFQTHNLKGHEGVITVVAFHPQKLELFTCDSEGEMKRWNLQTKKHEVLKNHMSAITGLSFIDNAKKVVTVGRDKVFNVWDLLSNKSIKTVPVYQALEGISRISPLETSYQDCLVVMGGENGTLGLWNTKSGKCLKKSSDEKQTFSLQSIRNTGNGKVMCSTSDQNIIFFSEDSLAVEKQLVGHNDEIVDMKYMKDYESIAVATNSEEFRIFSLATGDTKLVSGHKDIVLSLDVSHDGKYLASTGKDKIIIIWNTENYEKVAVLKGHAETVNCLSFPNRASNFIVSGSRDKTIKCWDISFLDTIDAEEEKDDGLFEVTGSFYTSRAHTKEINCMRVAPNDKIFATSSMDKLIKVWDFKTGTLMGTLSGHRRGVWSIDFSPVDRCIASASGDKTIKIWSLKDYSCIKTFEGHNSAVLSVRFLNSGMQLLSAASSGIIKLWVIKTNQCINTFDEHKDKVWALEVRKSDEEEIISGGGDSIINIWKNYTEIEKQEEEAKRDELILKKQELDSSVYAKKWKQAVNLALEIEAPHTLRKVFVDIIAEEKGDQLLEEIVSELPLEKISSIFTYCRDWNTNARHAVVAQSVLNAIFVCFPPSVLKLVPNIKQVLEGLVPYTDRHLERINKLLQKSYIIDYTLKNMN
eukprot:CAMPEP_0174252616 /NCGR_PEP_ID=MMETSP0439-20130205/2009_1 /TAXON_ID=0 /ORGANISM="Stereomyxa ramosa, Strain Chinc5" /LENGTH=771 /DNA_ID=CAMNT_0015333179 /DNA_START=57 /DNA_END=2369 /DNA_ORIENTATION=-